VSEKEKVITRLFPIRDETGIMLTMRDVGAYFLPFSLPAASVARPRSPTLLFSFNPPFSP
jgi:hypothetical protein